MKMTSPSSRGENLLTRWGRGIRSWFARPPLAATRRSSLAHFLELEDRALLSGTPFDPEIIAPQPALGDASANHTQVSVVATEPAQPPCSAQDCPTLAEQQGQTQNPADQAGQTTVQFRHEVVFVDSAVNRASELADQIRQSSTPQRQLDVYLLEKGPDAIHQIGDALASYTNLDSLHIISHGTNAGIKIGDTWLTPETLKTHAQNIGDWNAALKPGADVLIYGCDVASDAAGQEFVRQIGYLTESDVAASTNLTGHRDLGGDWSLEYIHGKIETQTPLTAQSQDAWTSSLAMLTVSTTNDVNDGDTSSIAALLANKGADGQISLREAIFAANNTAGSDTIVLPTGTYVLTGGELNITDHLSIDGASPQLTIIDGNDSDRVFHTRGSSNVSFSRITIQGGSASDNGGGVFVDGSSIVTIVDSVLTNNDGQNGQGGAIHVHGTLNLNRVLLSNNTASEGGAIHFHGADGGSLVNVTVSGNTASDKGGGIWTDTVISIKNSTIVSNVANTAGGIHVNGSAINISNTIVAGNTAFSANSDVAGSYNSDGYNLIQVVGSATGFGSDITGVNPNLQALANNGGQTPTHALSVGSAAIDAGTSTGAPATDQRGYSRSGATDIGAFEFNGVNPNTAPTITSNGGGPTASLSVAENTTTVTTVTANDADLPAQPLTYSITGGTDAAHFTVDSSSGVLAFVTAPNFESPADADANNIYSVTVQVSDGAGGVDSQVIEVTVTNVNDAPKNAVPGPQDIPAGGNYFFRADHANVISVSDEDALGTDVFQVTLSVTQGRVQIDNVPGITYVSGSNNTATFTIQGSLDAINDALDRLKYKPVDTYIGSATLTITTNDLGHNGPGGPATATDTINLNIVANSSPVLDLDTDDSSGQGGSGYKTLFSGSPVLIADVDATLTDAESVTLEAMTVTIQNPIDGINEFLVVDTSGTDIIASYSNGVLSLTGVDLRANYEQVLRTIRYHNLDSTPTGGSRTISVVANDGNSDSNVATTLVTINPSPIALNDAYSTLQAVPIILLTGGVLDNDSDSQGDSLTADLVSSTSNGLLLFNPNGTFTYTPGPLFTGIDTFTYRAFDGTTYSNIATVTITVGVGNAPPVAMNDAWTATEDSPLTIAANGVLANDTDLNGNALAALLVTGPTNGSLTLNADGSFTYTPDQDFFGTDSFTYQATDGLANSNVATVTITVNPVNDAPTASDNFYTLDEDNVLSVAPSGLLVNDTDIEGTALNAILVTGPSNGTLILNSNGSFQYTPHADFNGLDSFRYKANDGGADSNMATVTITINSVNDAPVNQAPGSQTTPSESPLVFEAANGNALSIGDVDAVGSDTFEVSLSVANGRVQLKQSMGLLFVSGMNDSSSMTVQGSLTDLNAALGRVTFTPDNGFVGSTAITLISNDLGNRGSGGSNATATTVTIEVQAATQPTPLPLPTPLPQPTPTLPVIPPIYLIPTEPIAPGSGEGIDPTPATGGTGVSPAFADHTNAGSATFLVSASNTVTGERALAATASETNVNSVMVATISRKDDQFATGMEGSRQSHPLASIHVESTMRPLSLPLTLPVQTSGPGEQHAVGPRSDLLENMPRTVDNDRQRSGSAFEEISAGSFMTTGLVATAGYLLLNPRSLAWILALAASRSAWKSFDPLEVIYAWEAEDQGQGDEAHKGRTWWSEVGLK